MAMKQVNPWSVKGIETNTRETAKEAARRAGMTVGQWLNTVIQQSADQLGEARARVRDSTNDSLDQRETVLDEQIESLEERLAEMAQHLRSVQALGSLHRPIEDHRTTLGIAPSADQAPDHGLSGAAHHPKNDPAVKQLETDVMDMASAIRGLNQRMDTSEEESHEKWNYLENHLGGLDSKLDRLIAGNNPEPLEEAVDNIEAENLPNSVPELETQRAMLEQIEAMRQRLDSYTLNPPAEAAPATQQATGVPSTLTTTLTKLVDRLDMLQDRISEPRQPIEDALLNTIDQTLVRMEDGVQSLSRSFDPDSIAERIAVQQNDVINSVTREHGAAIERASTSGFMDLQQAIDDIAKRQQNLETAVTTNRPIDFDLRFESLSRQLDEALSVRDPDVTAINQHLRDLTDVVKAAADSPQNEFESIQRRFNDLEARVEHALSVLAEPNKELSVSLRDLTHRLKEPDPAIEELKDRLQAVSAKVEQGMAASAPNVENLNRQLGLIIDQIEFTGKGQDRNGAELSQLATKLDVIAERVDTSLAQVGQNVPHQPDHQLAALEAKLNAIGERIEDSLNRPVSQAGDTRAIETTLHEIGQRIETSLAQPAVASVDTSGIEAQLNRLHERMELAPVAAPDAIEGRLDALGDQIKRSLAANQYGTPDLAPLETKLDTLAERIGHRLEEPAAQQADRSVLEERLDSMVADIHASLEKNRPDTSAIESRIASLIEHLERSGPTQDNDALRTIDHQLQSLTEKLESMPGLSQMAASGDQERLSGLESRIADIGTRLDETHSGVRNLQSIESGLKELFTRLDSSHSTAVEAAREAAKAAIFEADATDGAHAGSVFNSLQGKIAEIRDHADENDRRTRDTLSAVHSTLEQVVSRMRALETNSRGPSQPDRFAPSPHPSPLEGEAPHVDPAMDPASKKEAVAPDIKAAKPKRRFTLPGLRRGKATQAASPDLSDSVGADDLPPPEKFTPEPEVPDYSADPEAPPVAPRARMVSSTSRLHQDDPESETGNDPKTDFIAAARRAAQMAARNMDDDEQRDPKQAATGQGLKARFTKIRKPVTYTAIGLLLVIGCVQIIKVMTATSDPEITNSVSTSMPAVPAADYQSDLAPETSAAIDPIPETSLPPLTSAEESDDGLAENESPLFGGSAIEQAPIRVVGLPKPEQAGIPPLEIDPFDQLDGASEAKTVPAPDTPTISTEAQPTDTDALLATLPADQFPETLRQAAAGGDPIAQYEVAARFAEGSKLSADLFRASEWYARAAGQGLAPAQYRLGSLYEKGQGVEADVAIAKLWYERSALQGNRKAMHNLAVLLAGDKLGEPDFAQAAKWFHEAAQLGLADSQFNLAVLRARGFGVDANPAEAYKWFSLVANNGDKLAIERRDQIAEQLDEDTLVAAKLSVQSWIPRQMVASANTVTMPEGGWGKVTVVAQDPAAKAAQIIKQTQLLLNERGFDVGTPDGVIGPQTATAIRAFERTQGLQESGVVTPKLIKALMTSTG